MKRLRSCRVVSEKKGEERKDKKEGDFIGENFSMFACPASAYAYCYLSEMIGREQGSISSGRNRAFSQPLIEHGEC